MGNRKWEKGYLEIPNPAWCWFENSEITVPANGNGLAKISLKVPNHEKYYNQHWVVTLGVMGKSMVGPGVALGVYVRLLIQTQSKADIGGKPDGSIAFMPSTVRFDNVPLGRKKDGSVLIFNNDNETRLYRVEFLLDNNKKRARRYLTNPHQMIPNSSWIAINPSEFRVFPGTAYPLTVMVTVPEELKYYGKKWEELLLVEPDKGPSGFVRIQIETRKAGAN